MGVNLMKIWSDCHWNQRLRFTTVAKVILHGAFLARVSVCASCWCVHPAPGNASPAYLASTQSRRPRGLGASGKAAKAPAESRGKSRARQLLRKVTAAAVSRAPDPNPAPSLRHSSRPLYPTAAAGVTQLSGSLVQPTEGKQ